MQGTAFVRARGQETWPPWGMWWVFLVGEGTGKLGDQWSRFLGLRCLRRHRPCSAKTSSGKMGRSWSLNWESEMDF